MLHPKNRSSIRCTTSMASLLLSFRSSQVCRDTLYLDVPATDHYLVETTSTYQTTLRATVILSVIVATLTLSPQGILCRVLPADFMQEEEATISLPLMLKCFTRQPLRTNRQALLLSYLISALLLSLHPAKRVMASNVNNHDLEICL